jgi:hypothetical protein
VRRELVHPKPQDILAASCLSFLDCNGSRAAVFLDDNRFTGHRGRKKSGAREDRYGLQVMVIYSQV